MRALSILLALATLALLAAGCYPVSMPVPEPTAALAPLDTPTAPVEPDQNATPPEGLIGVTWQWAETHSGGEPLLAPAEPARYTLRFQPDGIVAVQADCNRGSGSYTVNGAALHLGAIATTKMACAPDSLDSDFLRQLSTVVAWGLSEDSLVLGLASGAGEMRFAAGAPATTVPEPTATAATGTLIPQAPTGEWALVSFLDPAGTPIELVADSETEIAFTEDAKISGTAGCNRFFGAVTFEAEKMTLSSLGSTQMACLEPLMTQEEAVMKALLTARTWQVADDTLTISYGDARGALVFNRK